MAHFNVDKDAQKVKFLLEKKNLPKITSEVVATIDLSGSTKELYQRGHMQEAIQRVVPVALNFDDNGELPVYGFNDGDAIVSLAPLNKDNYAGYVDREILKKNIQKWGGTDYAPVLALVLQDLGFYALRPTGRKVGGTFGFGKKDEMVEVLGPSSKSGMPAIVYHFTDGENTDKEDTRKLLRECADKKVAAYFNFIGVGTGTTFSFLRKAADDYPNVGFTQIMDLTSVGASDEIYEHLLPEELLEWLKAYVR